MMDGTSPYGEYGSLFEITALSINIIVYAILLSLAVFGVCNRRSEFNNIQPDEVDDEEDEIKEERQRVGDQLTG